MAIRKRLSFLLNDELVQRDAVPTDLTLLDFLRIERRLTGTKEGCAEGDCGACTVLVGTKRGDDMDYAPVNACIRLMPSLDARHVVTVEHLGGRRGDHPVQEAMVACHGSQCGFCTPGIVMALAAHRLRGGGDAETALQGNLCRCTGYGPILAAAALAAEATLAEDPLRAPGVAARLAALEDGEDMMLEGPGGVSWLPASVESFAELLTRHPKARIVAGGTDFALAITKRLEAPAALVFTGRVAGFDRLTLDEEALRLGPGVTFAQAQPALDAALPALAGLWRRIAGPQVREAGTIAGNVANGSPIGDSPPVLIALGARLVLRRGDARREIALEDFFLAYGRQNLRPGEFIEEIVVPRPRAEALVAAHKVSKRFDEDISALLGAFHIDFRDGVVVRARIAYGGMAGVPKRARAVEAALTGRPWTEATVLEAQAAYAQDFQPVTDLRAGAAYRLQVARNLLLRVYLDAAGEGADLRSLAHV